MLLFYYMDLTLLLMKIKIERESLNILKKYVYNITNIKLKSVGLFRLNVSCEFVMHIRV